MNLYQIIGMIFTIIGLILGTYGTFVTSRKHKDEIVREIASLRNLINVEGDLAPGLYRFIYKNENGQIITEEKTIDEFVEPYVISYNQQIDSIKDSLKRIAKKRDTDKKVAERLKTEIDRLKLEKLELTNKLNHFLDYVARINLVEYSKTFQKASELILIGEIEKAIKVLDEKNLSKDENAIIELVKSKSDLRLLKARALLIKGERGKAEKNYIKSIDLNLNFSNTISYADFLITRNKYEEAIRYYELALSKATDGKDVADAYEAIGISYAIKKDFDSSIKFLIKAFSNRKQKTNSSANSDLDLARTLKNISVAYISNGSLQEAIKYLEEAESIFNPIYGKSPESVIQDKIKFLLAKESINSFQFKNEESVKILQELKNILDTKSYVKNLSYYEDLSAVNIRLLNQKIQKRDFTNTENIIQENIEFLSVLSQEYECLRINYASTLSAAAFIYNEQKNPSLANIFHQRGIKEAKALYKLDSHAHFDLYYTVLSNYVSFLGVNDKFVQCASALKEIENILSVKKHSTDIISKHRKAELYKRKGMLFCIQGKVKSARKELLFAKEIMDSLQEYENREFQKTMNTIINYLDRCKN